MNALSILLFILFSPDTYIYIGWGLLLLLTLIVVAGLVRLRRRRWLRVLMLVTLLLCWWAFLWGSYVGVRQLRVVHVEFTSADLPKEFVRYRIVQFSDAHVGTFTGWRKDLLRKAIDSINAQHADAVVFTGDLKNKTYDEITEHLPQLRRIKARDGVFSVLGNHDYPMYISDFKHPYELELDQGMVENYQDDMGWVLLTNGRHRIRRDSASIVIAGMENDGEGRFPQLGDVNSALFGIARDEFVVMLEHDPSAWRRKILPHSHVQLTLSGHTHGGQFSLFGWSPVSLAKRYSNGMYYMGNRALYVSPGLSGVIPFRLGVPPEITVITLRSEMRNKQ